MDLFGGTSLFRNVRSISITTNRIPASFVKGYTLYPDTGGPGHRCRPDLSSKGPNKRYAFSQHLRLPEGVLHR
jgi:hypothetical protein